MLRAECVVWCVSAIAALTRLVGMYDAAQGSGIELALLGGWLLVSLKLARSALGERSDASR